MASEAAKPVKGILKKQATPRPGKNSTSGRAPLDGKKAEEDLRAREIALQHARIIQDRKDAEAQITDNIVQLTDYPLVRSSEFSASRPAPSDAAGFKALIRMFQPSDYDDLIAERNTCELCGYALCPRPRVSFGGKGTWKLVNAGRADFSIVERRELERWCSQECARRAMYVKVQLNETAAWERVGIPDIQIDLLEEEQQPDERSEQDRLAAEMSRLKLEAERKAAQKSTALAQERGEQTSKPVDLVIREKKVTERPEAPVSKDASDKARTVEGHQTKFEPKG
jgi:hypothetical protein